jgi:hypothetical protein
MADQTQDSFTARQAQAETNTARLLEVFTAVRPDWPRHEAAMVQYAQKLPPGSLDYGSYLDVLYFLACRDDFEQQGRSRRVVDDDTRAVPVLATD